MIFEVLQADGDVLRLLSAVNGHDEEVDEPGERVLVHGVDVGQVSDGEEEDG